MNSVLNWLISVSASSFFETAFLALFAGIFLNTRSGRIIIDVISNKIFYSESTQNKSQRLVSRIRQLELKISALEKSVSSKVLQDKIEIMDSEIKKYLEENLENLIAEHIKRSNTIENTALADIESKVAAEVKSFLGSSDAKAIVDATEKTISLNYRLEKNKDLETQINNELNNAGRVKTVMINLFLIFNFGILGIYLSFGDKLPKNSTYAITGLYVSLAMFIIYIYRTANFRSSVLLAIREDGKKVFDAVEYLEKYKKGVNLSNTDVELVKLLLTNRAEREKMSEHPYEVVLKGVANSNIQFKGGKMALKEEKKKGS